MLTPIEPVSQTADLVSLIARVRSNVEQSRWLRARARLIVARSSRLCPTPIFGSSDGSELDAVANSPAASGARQRPVAVSETRRSVLVLAHDPLMRAFVADAIRGEHDIVEASDVQAALKVVAGRVRVDVVVAGCFMLGEAGATAACTGVARELYDAAPWLPVAMIAETPPVTLRADVLLTGVRTFVSKDFTPSELNAVVVRVARRPDAAVPSSMRVAAVKQSFDALERMLSDVPPLATLAAMASMSRSHFSRTFHAVAGISLRDYVRDLRLKRAQQLMRGSRMSLSTIASEAGFYDLPHFNKAFRHRFGMSPTQFRIASLGPPPSTA